MSQFKLCLEKFISTSNCTKEQEEILLYNLAGGKHIRMNVFLEAMNDNQSNSQNEPLTIGIIGWCIEILQAYFLISDDIIDNSETRRNKTSWFIKKGISQAYKDCHFLLCFVNKMIIQSRCKNKIDLINCLNRIALKTWLGQCHDSLEKEFDKINEIYSFENYTEILKAKTSFYTFILPIRLAYICKDMIYKESDAEITHKLAFLAQFQDDYLNYFPKNSMKSGTDIEEKKVTWFMCKLMLEYKNCRVFQMLLYDYLTNDMYFDLIEKLVRSLFVDYEKEEKKLYEEIKNMIHYKDKIYLYILNLLFKRKY